MRTFLKIIIGASLGVAALPGVRAQTLTISERISWTTPDGNSTLTMNNSGTITTIGTNFNWTAFTVSGTTDSVVSVPAVSNAYVFLVNESPTSTPTLLQFGNTVSNYQWATKPAEFGGARMIITNGVHLSVTNGVTQSGHIATSPNP